MLGDEYPESWKSQLLLTCNFITHAKDIRYYTL